MVPPYGQHDDFARGLTYVALSRVKMLSGLDQVEHKITTQMFTKWARQIEPITFEYTRLRALPHWILTLAAAAPSEVGDTRAACSDAN